ncbi:MAG: hypothetical protein SGJ00_01925 [bacterium]|nr:hypothetical protein [bacterium]
MKFQLPAKFVLSAILIVSAMLALIQFLYCRSLWVDEAMLALNIIQKSAYSLLFPLDYNQVAPILFLEIEKLFSWLIPNSELGLRIFPLLSFIAAIFLFKSLVAKLFSNGLTQIFALVLFAFNPKLLYFSGEVKQYIVDVALINLCYFLVVMPKQYSPPHYLILTLTGVFGIFLSNTAPMILFAVICFLCIQNWQMKSRNLVVLAMVFSTWILTFAGYYFLFLAHHPSQEVMTGYWNDLQGFIPINPFSSEFFPFYLQKVITLKTNFGIPKLVALTIPLFLLILGIVKLVRTKKYSLLVLLLMPLFCHLGLSALKLYPFDTRLVLYLFTPGILLMAFGFDLFQVNFLFFQKSSWILAFSIALPLLGLSFIFLNKKQFKREEIKEALQYISAQQKQVQSIYVYYAALPAFTYYKQTHLQAMEILPSRVIEGKMHHDDHRKYGLEIGSEIKGKTWLLFTHQTPEIEQEILDQLNLSGIQIEQQFKTVGASVYILTHSSIQIH